MKTSGYSLIEPVAEVDASRDHLVLSAVIRTDDPDLTVTAVGGQ